MAMNDGEPQAPSSSLFYKKAILAPMVRVCSLGFRTLCATNGADVVFTEEVVAAKLRACQREVRRYPSSYSSVAVAIAANKAGADSNLERSDVECADAVAEYVAYEPFKGAFKRSVALAVHEGGGDTVVPVVLQLGACDGEVAADAAALCCQDISAVDVNMGCPKKFSVSNGFGAALMEKTSVAGDILRSIHNRLNSAEALAQRQHRAIPISFKTRLKDRENAQATADMLREIAVAAGHSLSTPVIHAITLHARVREQRSEEPPLLGVAAEVVQLCRGDAASPLSNVCFVLNGSIASRQDGLRKCAEFGFDGFMIARAALCDPIHTFRHPLTSSSAQVSSDKGEDTRTESHYMGSMKTLMLYAVRYRTDFKNFKYHLTRAFPEVACIKHRMSTVQSQLRSYEDCFGFFGLSDAERASCRAWAHDVEMFDALPKAVKASLDSGDAPISTTQRGANKRQRQEAGEN